MKKTTMKKLNLWLLLSLFVATYTLSACGGDDDDSSKKPDVTDVQGGDGGGNNGGNGNQTTSQLTVSEETLQGTWDGYLEHDFAQGYYQRWRIHFDGKNYTSWHTHLTAGSTNDEVQGLKTVGDKAEGTWEYKDGKLVLTPKKMYASYYLTAKSINDPYYYVYYNYNAETMESDTWYETADYIIAAGIERDIQDGADDGFYLRRWPVVSLTKTTLSVKINMDVFNLTNQNIK